MKLAESPLALDREQLVTELTERLPRVLAIYLHGSRARKEANQASDLDLAVLSAAELPPLQVWETAQYLASQLGLDVDLLDLRKASTVMQMQVITRGERLYCRDKTACEEFEDLVFSQYAWLNEERAGILRDIAQRGSIHG